MATVQGYQQLQHRLQAVGASSTTLMQKLGVRAMKEQRLLVRPHKKTGLTENSIHLTNLTPRSVTTVVGHAGIFLEYGTRPHTITPNVARVLAWGGARRLSGSLRSGSKPTHFAMVVHHPGTRAYPFMIPGARIAVRKAGVDAVVSAWNEAA